jgi:DNA repair exonuclease SbcCD ATPase subunit
MMIDRLRTESQQFLMKYPSVVSQSREVVLKSQQRLLGIFNDWELLVEELMMRQDSLQNIMKRTKQALRQERESCKKLVAKLDERKAYWARREQHLTEEVAKIKQHLEEGKLMWEVQMTAIQKAIVETQDEREQLEEQHSRHIQTVEFEVRNLMEDIKGERHGLLAELFSRHDLEEEGRVALGGERNLQLSIDLRSIRSCESQLPEVTALDSKQIYGRLKELLGKISELSNESSLAASSATLNQGFIDSLQGSLPASSRQESPTTVKHISEFADFSQATQHRSGLDEDDISSIEDVPCSEVQ